MTTLPEEAVKAAIDAFHLAWNNNQGLDNELPAYAHRAAITAALPFIPVQVAVKNLKWRGADGVWYKADAEFGGTYRIAEYPGMAEPFKLTTLGWWEGLPCGHYKTLEDAKAAAQADYERRILAALEPAATCNESLQVEPAAPEGQQPVADALELSGNTGELIDRMAEAIRGDTTTDETPWALLSEDRKIGWRGDAERALAVVKEYLTARALSSPDHADAGKVAPLANLIHDALAFAVWAAGEGLCPTDGPPAPEDFLHAYSAATGVEDWDAIPHHGATTLSALARLRETLANLVQEINDLISESEGVAGLHLNGDVATWGDLLPGGPYERLTSLDDARRALTAQKTRHD